VGLTPGIGMVDQFLIGIHQAIVAVPQAHVDNVESQHDIDRLDSETVL
jgi:hypothetical protein